jgi:membrane glycosyltransferase
LNDILKPLFWMLAVGAIAAFVFRGVFWLRISCIAISLVSVLLAMVRLHIAPRIAVDTLHRHGKPWSEAFRDGGGYTHAAVLTAMPIILLSATVLAGLALFPHKPKTPDNENTRNA